MSLDKPPQVDEAQPVGEAQRPTAKGGRRWRRIVVVALALGAAAFLAAVGWLVGSASGARWALRQAAAQLPGEVGYGAVNGRLLGPLGLRDIVYRQPGEAGGELVVRVESLDLAWHPWPLAVSYLYFSPLRLDLSTLRLAGVRIDLPPPGPEEADSALPEIRLPLDLAVADASITEVSITRVGELLVENMGLTFEIRFANDTLFLDRLRAEAPALGSVDTSGTLRPQGAYPLELDLSWRLAGADADAGDEAGGGDASGEEPASPAWSGRGTLSGDLAELRLVQAIEEPFAARVEGQVRHPLGEIGFSGQLATTGVELTRLNPEWPALRLDGEAEVDGTLDSYTLTLDANVSGRLADTTLSPTALSLRGQGSGEGIDIEKLRIALLDGKIEADGRFAWTPEVSWDLEVTGDGLDPEVMWSDWPGRVEVRASSQGRVTENGPRIRVEASRLAGELRGRAFESQGLLTTDGQTLQLEDLSVDGGFGRLRASGELAESWDMRWELSMPDLSAFPEAAGALTAQGELQGLRQTPRVVATFDGRDLVWQTYQVGELRGQGDVSLEAEGALNVELVARDMVVEEQAVASFEVAVQGTLASHALDVAADLGSETDLGIATLQLTAEGSYAEELWSGEVASLGLRSSRYGAWALETPVHLDIAQEEVRIEEACWQSEDGGRFCLAADQAAAGWSARGEVANLPLALFAELLPPGVGDGGSPVGGRFSATHSTGGESSASLTLDPIEGTWRVDLVDDEVLEQPYRLHAVEARLTPSGWVARSGLEIAGGRLELSAALPGYRFDAPWRDLALNGRVRGELPDLRWLGPLVPELSGVEGSAEIDLWLAGAAVEPQLQGDVRIRGRAVVPELGIALEDVDITATSVSGEALRIKGSAQSGDGKLAVSGTLPFPPTVERPAVLRITGDRFLAVDRLDSRIWLTLDLETRIDDQQVALTGDLEVPKAVLRLEAIPAAVPISVDAVVVGGDTPEPATGPRVIADVRVELGDEVAVSGQGFAGRIVGELGVKGRPDGSFVGSGQLRVREGLYEAYGQSLVIDDGQVNFTSSPLDDPGLSIRAFRKADDDVVAGLHIRGTLREPLVELYSNPALPQMDALSYLLFGHRTRGNEESDVATSAALSLGLATSKALLGRIGIDEVSIDPGRSVADAALVLGTYVGPDLFVSYGVGLFRSLHILRLRYSIDKHWSVQAEQSQEESAGDILYSIER